MSDWRDSLLAEMRELLNLAAEIWMEVYGASSWDPGDPLPGTWTEPGADAFRAAFRARRLLLVSPSAPAPGAFDRFWAVYPRHVARKEAQKAFESAIGRATADVIIEGARRYAADPNRVDRFTKHPTTWLRGDCWADDPLPQRLDHQRPPQEVTGEAQRALARRNDERRNGEPQRASREELLAGLEKVKGALVKSPRQRD